MKYELTPDLLTGSQQIDMQHRQLFEAVNRLMDACSMGKGRDQIQSTITFLSDYVVKHCRLRAATPATPATNGSTTNTSVSCPSPPRSCFRRAPPYVHWAT